MRLTHSFTQQTSPKFNVSKRDRRARIVLRVSSAASPDFQTPAVPSIIGTKNVVVLGGSGRVGSSTAAALKNAVPNVNLTIASRSQSSYTDAVSRRPQLRDSTFKACNIDNPSELMVAISGADLVIHAAGPFQRRTECNVLEASIAAGVPYLDVCDDTEYAKRAKRLHEKAKSAGVPAISTAGIYPGVSNVMAAHMISLARKEYNEDWSYKQAADDAPKVDRILYSYYTAGSGGAGPTILETSFLLAGEDVVAYKDGNAVTVPPVSNRRGVDFGPGIGRKSVYLYSLPEVATGHQVFGVPNISARFGTAPDIWNWAMVAVARLVPKSVLEDRESVSKFAQLVDPLVRVVDMAVGERVAMLVDTRFDDGKSAAGLYVHDKLSDSVGIATSAFARSMLAGHTSPGVWWPEEKEALSNRLAFLQMANEGTRRFLVNKPLWAIESNPIYVGMDKHQPAYTSRMIEGPEAKAPTSTPASLRSPSNPPPIDSEDLNPSLKAFSHQSNAHEYNDYTTHYADCFSQGLQSSVNTVQYTHQEAAHLWGRDLVPLSPRESTPVELLYTTLMPFYAEDLEMPHVTPLPVRRTLFAGGDEQDTELFLEDMEDQMWQHFADRWVVICNDTATKDSSLTADE